MNKIFTFFVLLPFFAVASYDLSPIEDCERLKENMIQDLNYQESTILEGINPALLTFTNRIDSLIGQVDAIRRLDTDNDFEMDLISLRGNIASLNNNVYYTLEYSNDAYEYTQYLKATVNAINCTTCDGSSSSNCCDFTEILQAIGGVSNTVNMAVYELSVISNQLNSLEYTNFLLEHGFEDTTNILSSIQGVVTNLVKNPNNYGATTGDRFTYIMYGGSLNATQRDWWSNLRYSKAFSPMSYGYLKSLYDVNYLNFLQLSSLNNYSYEFSFNRFPILTNTVGAIHRDTTNFFSFFRGEIGVRGVLEDWTNEESDGTYHDFLTNHYINVVRGGSLSGNSSTKTNWFSRIETLLASLVFLDSSNTNAYDSASQSVSNGINRVKDDFNSTLDGVSSASSTQMELVSDIEKSMYESLRSFSQAFSSASLPSSVRLIYVYKTSGNRSLSLSSDTVDVTVPVEGKLMDFVEIIRSATTLCWVFFGLWFMFKFSVWTVKKIYMLIRYIIDFFNMVAGGK